MNKTINYEITYKTRGDLNSIKYISLDYAGYKDTRQSTEGNLFIIAERPVS